MTARITDLEIDAVAIVDRAANRRRILALKAEDGELTEDEKAQAAELVEVTSELLKQELVGTAKRLIGTDPDYAAAVLGACEAANMQEGDRANVRYAMRMLGPQMKTMPRDVVAALAKEAGLTLAPEEEEQMPEAAIKIVKSDKGVVIEGGTDAERQLAQQLLDATKADADARVEAAKAEATKATTDLTKRVEKAEQDLAAERLATRKREFAQKGEALVALGKADEVGEILRQISDVNPELGTKVEGLLTSAASAVKAADSFKVYGGRGGEVAGSAEAELRAHAQEIVAKAAGTASPVTMAQALLQAAREKPDVYRRSQAEKKAAARAAS